MGKIMGEYVLLKIGCKTSTKDKRQSEISCWPETFDEFYFNQIYFISFIWSLIDVNVVKNYLKFCHLSLLVVYSLKRGRWTWATDYGAMPDGHVC